MNVNIRLSDMPGALKAARECLAAIEELRRDFVSFRTDDGGMRFVKIADVISLHEWENEHPMPHPEEDKDAG